MKHKARSICPKCWGEDPLKDSPRKCRHCGNRVCECGDWETDHKDGTGPCSMCVAGGDRHPCQGFKAIEAG